MIANIGSLLRAQRKYEQAEPYYREALEKFRRVLGEEHPTTLNSIDSMGLVLRRQGNFAEAETLLVSAAAIAETKLPPGHSVKGLLVRALVELYDAWHAAEPGQGFDAKAAEWRTRLLAPAAAQSDDDGHAGN